MAEPQIDVPDKILELVERWPHDRERLRRQIEAGDGRSTPWSMNCTG
jgi:hypothetical protein